MQQETSHCLALASDLDQKISQLASLEPSDAPFLSCYLDARRGAAACRQYLAREARLLRPTLAGVTRLDFESAFDRVNTALRHPWPAETRGVAIFARGLAGEAHLDAIPLAVPLANRMSWYRIPDIAPLVATAAAEQRFALVMVRGGALQVLGIEGGKPVPRVWAAQGLSRAGRPGQAVQGQTPLFDLTMQNVRRVLLAEHSTPVVIAGDADALERVARWLPRRLLPRLLNTIPIPPDMGERQAIDRVRGRLQDSQRIDAMGVVARFVRALRVRGQAVAGPMAVREALHGQRAQALVIADGHCAEQGWVCDACGVNSQTTPTPACCPECGRPGPSAWDPVIELTRLAIRQGARVVFADSDELRYLGGIGCLLTQHAEHQVMSEPGTRTALDLVA